MNYCPKCQKSFNGNECPDCGTLYIETIKEEDNVNYRHEDMDGFIIKDSGKRKEFDGGMVRDINDNKVNYLLINDGPMLKRWAIHLTKGANKYAKRNWMLASGEEEYERFKESAFRHFMQWLNGDTDEDHASATMFNINGAEYVKSKINEK